MSALNGNGEGRVHVIGSLLVHDYGRSLGRHRCCCFWGRSGSRTAVLGACREQGIVAGWCGCVVVGVVGQRRGHVGCPVPNPDPRPAPPLAAENH